MRMKKRSTLSLVFPLSMESREQQNLPSKDSLSVAKKDPERENAEGDSKKVNKKRKNSVLDPRAVVVER